MRDRSDDHGEALRVRHALARRSILTLAFVSLVALPLGLTNVACGDSEPNGVDEPVGARPTDGTDASGTATAPPATPDAGRTHPPCDAAQTAAIQARFDADAPNDVDALALVKDPSCGTRFFTRGPSKYPVDSLHLLASNTKTYVASLILLLAEDKLFSLDDSISKWIDKVPGGDAIHVRHLLDHSSGIYNYSNDNVVNAVSALGKKWTPQQLVDIGFGKKVGFAPGAGWDYSNTNYVLLGMIAEKATGKPVEQLLRERILTPIGSTATFFYGKETIPGEIAVGRTFLGGNGATFMDPSLFWCSGSFVGTIQDLATWVELRGSGRFHGAASNGEMLKLIPTSSEHLKYGAGLMVYDASSTHGGGDSYGHGGDLVGYHSYGLYFPDSESTVVVMVDSDKGPKGSFPLAATYREQLYFAVIDPLFGYTGPPSDGGADGAP